MKITHILCAVAFLTTTSILSSCQPEEVAPTPPPAPPSENPTVPTTPATAIPEELVGTWFAASNTGPLTANWNQGSFQGSQGFAEFRTMVFTKDGKNAVEYSSEVFNVGNEVQQRLYKIMGTLEYQTTPAPATLTFHAQQGTMRLFSNQYTGYKESPIIAKDIQQYVSILHDPQATTFSSSTNYLTAQRVTGQSHYAARYEKVSDTTTPTPPTTPGSLYTSPPATGTYVQIRGLYYPTMTIGAQEWMAVNYAGNGGIKDTQKPQYGTFFKFADLSEIPVPAGWRIPTQQDYKQLLASQGLALDMWGSTDAEDLASKKKLGQLMAKGAWKKQDGYATNSSGFTALPANLRALNASPNGEGSNGIWWTSERNTQDDPLAFQIIQLFDGTYASIQAFSVGFNPPHIPVRLVRDK